jgi:hypothetical protein
MRNLQHRLVVLFVAVLAARAALADNQTATVDPIEIGGALPYQVSLSTYDFGAADLPTLQSFAAGTYDGKWVMLAGRTNGLHGFTNVGSGNFPAANQNHDVWVVDPVTKQSWSRSLDSDSTMTAQTRSELTTTNTEFAQVGDRLYVAGGYGVNASGSGFSTKNAITAIDLPGIVDWVMTGNGHATDHMRQAHDASVQVTGGAMYPLGGHMRLVFGQNFSGGYIPGSNGAYTQQVRSFDIVDDGTTLSIANLAATPQVADYRRRDLNVYPTIKRNADMSVANGLTALSGVFTLTNGAWTVPVEVDANGNPSESDPAAPGTFKQGMNGYDCAKLGLFSENTGKMHEILFGGISLEDYDPATQAFIVDNNLPFINQITSVVVDSDGHYAQHRIGEFPALYDGSGNRLRFGANADFFLAPGISTYDNGVIKLDDLTTQTTLGYIFGGLAANAPNTQGVPGAVSIASNEIFTVMYTPVPEPAGWVILASGGFVLVLTRFTGDTLLGGYRQNA